MNQDNERALRNFPETFKNELSAILAGAKNGGVISPRRHAGLLIQYDRVERRYAQKIASLRFRGPSPAIDEVEFAISKIAAEYVSSFVNEKAAMREQGA